MNSEMKYRGFDPGDEFRQRLTGVSGKTKFAEKELTREFYSKLYIACADLFAENGTVNLDRFWSPQLQEWLLHGDNCVELHLLSLLEMLPPDFDAIRDYLDHTELSPGKLTSTVIRFICEDCQFEYDPEKPPEALHSTYLYNLIKLLLEHGLDPNGFFESCSILDSLELIDTDYVAADTMNLLLQHGGDPYLKCDDEILFDGIEYDVLFGAHNQENRDIYDHLIHLWLVMIGHGAKSLSADGERKMPAEVFEPPVYEGSSVPFSIESFKEHRNFTWALSHVPGNGENWSLHIIDRATGWEVLRL